MRARYTTALGIAGFVLALDQVTKARVAASIPLWEGFPVVPGFFNMVHVLNRGAAFGFLNRTDIEWQTTFFIVTALAAVGLILYLLRGSHCADRLSVCGLGLVLGGALGNLVDRIRIGAVIDFLDFHVGAWHWPAFNVADIAICLGVCALTLTLLKTGNSGETNE
ncbi:signal peptidase II [Desulfobaculum xiamenense]|uniref:Lipoprotein signal peptidase n=1 Tax=Desulfobaculum xiamenense TaxID=995050 RepID=A0A846QID4_9BACT|nr:signal peptidase II [Desulfobaculum xiamenense]NJB66860.1 signal peptidase II [Desulfobaculum xiamenense]